MDNATVVDAPAERLMEENIEIVVLSITIVIGTIFNLSVFYRFVRTSKAPTASTSFLTGPYQTNSFTLFKINLTITDFAILLVHALGKVVWLSTYEWKFGSSGCKLYQFLSAFTYYSNSNVVVAIGLDRLKVVYTSHIQGATSVRRVRFMISVAWILAAICALPQLYVWQTVEPYENWEQCTTIWEIAAYEKTSTPQFERFQIVYEMFHQAMVFWMPFLILFSSYLLIVIRLLHHTLRPVSSSYEVRTPSGGQHTCLRMTSVPSSDQYLLSSTSTDTLQTDFCGIVKPIKAFKIPGAKHMKQLKCLLLGSSFSSRILQKRRTACLGSIRSCCRNADIGIPVDKSLPVWRRQLRSRIFLTSLAVVVAHVAMWLPYNLVNTMRFVDIDKYVWWLDHSGGRYFEDIIVFNAVINPLLYTYETR